MAANTPEQARRKWIAKTAPARAGGTHRNTVAWVLEAMEAEAARYAPLIEAAHRVASLGSDDCRMCKKSSANCTCRMGRLRDALVGIAEVVRRDIT